MIAFTCKCHQLPHSALSLTLGQIYYTHVETFLQAVDHSQAIFESKLESAMAKAWSADNGALDKTI